MIWQISALVLAICLIIFVVVWYVNFRIARYCNARKGNLDISHCRLEDGTYCVTIKWLGESLAFWFGIFPVERGGEILYPPEMVSEESPEPSVRQSAIPLESKQFRANRLLKKDTAPICFSVVPHQSGNAIIDLVYYGSIFTWHRVWTQLDLVSGRKKIYVGKKWERVNKNRKDTGRCMFRELRG